MAIQLGFRTALGQVPGTRGHGVLQCFEGVERLRRNDEQGGFGAQVGRQFVELAAIDVRQVVAAHATLRVGQQCLGDQLGAEERATDADVDHVGDRFFAVTAPQAVVDAPHQFSDLVEHLVHFGHHVDAVDAELVADRAAQGGVQHRAAFGGVDDLAVEHRLDGILQADFFGQVHQQVTALFVDQVFRVVEKQAAAAQRELVKALGVGGEGVTHAEVLHGVAVLLERLPCGQGRHIMGCTVIRHCGGFLGAL
ncbi:hypothetical protein D3C76_568200 [compost metagenome]